MDKYNLKEKTVCVIDTSGNYIKIAIELAKHFKEVLYFVEWREAFPTYQKRVIGLGVPNITRVYEFSSYKKIVDFWYITDLFYGAMASELRDEGKVVFGAGRGEIMEIDRKGFKDLMQSLDMPINPHEEIIGVPALREYLKENPNVYVKLNSEMRGHLETSHCENYDLFKPVLDSLEHALGWDSDTAVFLVEKPIDPAIEYGYDGSFNGLNYPNKTMFGLEIKDAAFGAMVVDYNKLPKPLRDFNEKLKPILQAYDYRCVVGNEIRQKINGDAYLTDIYCRAPQPPTDLWLYNMTNYGEFAYETAMGIDVKVSFKKKFGVQLIMKSDWAKTEPQAIYYDPKYADQISIKNLAVKDGISYYIPIVGCEMEEIGSVVGIGDTFKDAIKDCKKAAETVKGYGIKLKTDVFDELNNELAKYPKFGINIF
jgi:hypothetical protein